MIILSIETSCDETSVAVLENRNVLSNITISQIEQTKFGGVIPGLASRLHIDNIQKTLQQAILDSGKVLCDIDYIAYTEKPGLIICLQIGKAVAETLSLFLEKEIIPINHLEGHVYASLLNNNKEWKFPVLSLIISGGHTQLCLIKNYCVWKVIGDTRDDSIGECLDKVSVLYGFGYPGGPIIENLALSGRDTYKLPFPMNNKECDFSFSGLKTKISTLLANKDINLHNLSFSLQNLLVRIMIKKINNAIVLFPNIKTLVVGGGVIANKLFRLSFENWINSNQNKIDFFLPKLEYATDNAAMIGVRAFFEINHKKNNILK